MCGAGEIRNQQASDECKDNSRVSNRIGQNHVLGVDENQSHHRSGKGEVERERE